MENKKYRTFEIVDGKIKFTDTSSKFMRFCIGTAYFPEVHKETIEFLKRCIVIGYIFSGDFQKRLNVIIHSRIGATGKSIFVSGISKLYSLYAMKKGQTIITGREYIHPRELNLLVRNIEKTCPSFIHIDDMRVDFNYKSVLEETNKSNSFIPVIITTTYRPEKIVGFTDSSNMRRFYTCEFGDYYNEYHYLTEFRGGLFDDEYHTTQDYIQDIKFCMDCLDYYKDFNNDIV